MTTILLRLAKWLGDCKMAASSLVQSLENLILPGDPVYGKLFSLAVGGAKWTVASNKVWVVGAKGSGPYALWAAEPDRIARVTQLLSLEPSKPLTYVTEELISWATSGDPDEAFVSGCVRGVLVNTRALAKLLYQCPFKSIIVWNASDDEHNGAAIGLCAVGRWKAILAGVLGEAAISDFEPGGQQAVFDLAMDLA